MYIQPYTTVDLSKLSMIYVKDGFNAIKPLKYYGNSVTETSQEIKTV